MEIANCNPDRAVSARRPAPTRPPVPLWQTLVGVATLLGWFGVAVATAVEWVRSQPDWINPDACGGWCFTPRDGAAIVALYIGVPSALTGLAIAGVLCAWLLPRLRWGLLAGTAAALIGLIAGPLLVISAVLGMQLLKG